MKARLQIPDDLVVKLKAEALRRGRSIEELVEEILRDELKAEGENRQKARRPLPILDLGPPLVDISDRRELDRALSND